MEDVGMMLHQPGPYESEARRAHVERRQRLGMVAPRPVVLRPVPPVKPVAIAAEEAKPLPRILPATRLYSLQRAVAVSFGITVEEMLSHNKIHRLVRPRQVGMWLARKAFSYPLQTIGYRFGGRDHTTALHAFRKVEARRAVDEGFRVETDALLAHVLGGEA